MSKKEYIVKDQQGGYITKKAWKEKLRSDLSAKQDRTAMPNPIKNGMPLLHNYLNGQMVNTTDAENGVAGTPLVTKPRSQAIIDKPYDKSLREQSLGVLDKIDRNGDNPVLGTVTQPLKSALRVMRPDKYFSGVQNDNQLGDAIGRLAGDGLAAAPIFDGLATAGNFVRNIPVKVPLNPEVNYAEKLFEKPVLTPEIIDNFYKNAGTKPLGEIVSDKVSGAMNKRVIPTLPRRVLPNSIEFKNTYRSTEDGQLKGTTIEAVGDDGRQYGYIHTVPHKEVNYLVNGVKRDPDYLMNHPELFESVGGDRLYDIQEVVSQPKWHRPTMINIDERLQGNRLQDVLYQKAIDEAKRNGAAGVRSGDDLLQPEKTMKAYGRFDKELLAETRSYTGVRHPIVGLTQHTNPEVVTDWLAKYKDIPKYRSGRVSVNDILDNIKQIGKPAKVNQRSTILDWLQEKDQNLNEMFGSKQK